MKHSGPFHSRHSNSNAKDEVRAIEGYASTRRLMGMLSSRKSAPACHKTHPRHATNKAAINSLAACP